MKRFSRIMAVALVCASLLTGCRSSLTPKEWVDKQKEMGVAYGGQIVAGKYPASWSQFGELEDFAYGSAEFEAIFKISDTLKLRISEEYIGEAPGNKVTGHIKALVYSKPVIDKEADKTIKKLLDKAYGNLDWEYVEATEGTYAYFNIRESEYKPVFTADVLKMPYLDWEKHEGVSVFNDGYNAYFNALLKVLVEAEKEQETKE